MPSLRDWESLHPVGILEKICGHLRNLRIKCIQDTGSTRGLWDGDKLRLAKLNYAPYGEHDAVFGDATDLQFTGKTWDSEIGMY